MVEPTPLKNMLVKMGSSSPSFGVKINNVWNHKLESYGGCWYNINCLWFHHQKKTPWCCRSVFFFGVVGWGEHVYIYIYLYCKRTTRQNFLTCNQEEKQCSSIYVYIYIHIYVYITPPTPKKKGGDRSDKVAIKHSVRIPRWILLKVCIIIPT